MINYSNPIYECWLCKTKVQYDSYQKAVVQISDKKEHHCEPIATVRNTNLNVDFSQQIAEEEARRHESQFYQSRNMENKQASQELQEFNESLDINKKRHVLENSNTDGKSWFKNKNGKLLS